MVQLSHPCRTTGKTIALTRRTFVDKVMSLFFNMYYFMANRWGNNGNTAFGDCNHEIKRCLLPERKAMTNLDSILKSREITLLTKVHIVKTVVFPRWHSGKKNPPANAGDARDSGLIPG